MTEPSSQPSAGPADRFRRVAGAFGDVVARVPDDAWDAPAPCAGWTARDVVGHLVTWVPGVLGRSGLELPSEPTVEHDPAGAWAAFADAVQAAVDDPVTAATRFDAGPPGEMTVGAAVDMLVVGDVLVHTWDLGTAVGVDVTLDPVLAGRLLEGMEQMDEALRASGHYGPAVDVPADADVQTRLLAFTGRDPSSPPGPRR